MDKDRRNRAKILGAALVAAAFAAGPALAQSSTTVITRDEPVTTHSETKVKEKADGTTVEKTKTEHADGTTTTSKTTTNDPVVSGSSSTTVIQR